MTNPFAGYGALSFDCYGTLIDWEIGLATPLTVWASAHGVDAGREELLAVFSSIESVVETEQPTLLYPRVLGESLRRLAPRFGAEATDDECEAFGASVPEWPAFPDSAAALAALAERFKLIILSNVDRTSFAASNRRLGVTFDLVITAEDVGSYKPAAANFEMLLDRVGSIGVSRPALLHVAQSLFHDHAPAAAFGLPSVWIDRRAGKEGTGATPAVPAGVARPGWTYPSMAAFAEAALT
jgi:2-haloalkanoic acid dehalogenase type II